MMQTSDGNPLSKTVRALQTVLSQSGDTTSLIETHISFVLLCGDYAYKFKKPENLGFLDFSTLQKRKYYCEEELRLNQRLAPQLYIEVVRITGDEEQPLIGGETNAIEYAVKMNRFPSANELKAMLAGDRVTNRHLDVFAREIAIFHADASIASSGSSFGTPQTIRKEAMDNYEVISAFLKQGDLYENRVKQLQQWTKLTLEDLDWVFKKRKHQHSIRECHGDMHCGNIVLYAGRLTCFDCIEFSEELRWIDTISELAFLLMDLDMENKADYAWRILNVYLQSSADYEGLFVLRFYKIYRALVRAKVSCLRLQQSDLITEVREQHYEDCYRHLDLAVKYSKADKPKLLISHGLSGSGKSTVSQSLAEQLGTIILRSDIERKRLHQLEPGARTATSVGSGIYTKAGTARTYLHLLGLTKMILQAGYSVIVDATFLQITYRQGFMQLAEELGLLFVILDVSASEKELFARIAERVKAGDNASEADGDVLQQQIEVQEPLTDAELQCRIHVDTNHAVNIKQLATLIQNRNLDIIRVDPPES